jgi:hypothetical protein
MNFIFEEKFLSGTKYIEVKGTPELSGNITVPAAYMGQKVSRIGAHAFASNKKIESVRIPDSIDTVLGFAFHNCVELRKIYVTDSITEYLDGSVRQCDSLYEIDVTMNCGNPYIIRRVLEDCDKKLLFTIHFSDGVAKLIFPAYIYDFAENTMARTIQFTIEGAGMAYRECVRGDNIDFHAYDKLFERAIGDDMDTAGGIAVCRLMYPYRLSDIHRTAYETFLRKTDGAFLDEYIEQEDIDTLEYLGRHNLFNEKALERMISASASAEKLKALAVLMKYKKGSTGNDSSEFDIGGLDF